MSDNKKQLEGLFVAALDLEPGEERDVYLAKACEGDSELRQRVEKLLKAHNKAGTFLTQSSGQSTETDETNEVPTAETPFSEGIGTVIGEYKLLQKIGEGGFGVVYMAEQRKPVVRRVALKIIRFGMDTKQVVARFEAERQALALMEHPNIAKVLSGGTTDTGRPYFCMELVKGITITDYCDNNHLSTDERLELFTQVCKAVHHAHQKGIIHRDIKPSNVMVTLHDGKAVPKVIDFGIAKATQQRLTEKTLFTQFSQLIGTPAYMSPEQAEMSGLDVDTRTDVYSLGVLLYELLTGHTPFDPKELLKSGCDEMRRIVREVEPPKPSTRLSTLANQELTTIAQHRRLAPEKLSRAIRGELDWIVMKALEKDRSRRYDSSYNLAEDVKRYLDNEPVTAVAPSSLYKFKKFSRRHKGAFAAVGVIALLLVAATFVSTAGWVEAEHKSEEARAAQESAEQRRDEARLNLYVADMADVHRGLGGDISRTRGRLLAHVPRSQQETDFRGFEWRYLWDQSNPEANLPRETRILRGHADMPSGGLIFSQDDRMLISGGRDGDAIVWDLSTDQPIHRLPHPGWVRAVDLSRDSKYAASLSEGMVRIWDISGPEFKLRDELSSDEGQGFDIGLSRAIEFSRTEDLLVFDRARQGNETHLRTVIYDYSKQSVFLTLTNAGSFLDLSPNGRLVITGAREGEVPKVSFWDLNNQGALLCTRTNFNNPVHISPLGDSLATHTGNGLQLWNLDEVLDPEITLTQPRLYGAGSYSHSYLSPNERHLALFTDQAYLLDLETDQRLPAPAIGSFSSKGTEMVFTSSRTNLMIVPANTKLEENAIASMNDTFCFSPDSRTLALQKRDAPIALFDVDTMRFIRDVCLEDDGSEPLAFTQSGKSLFTYNWTDSPGGTLRRLDVASGNIENERHFDKVLRNYSLSPDNRFLGLLFFDGTVSVIDPQSFAIKQELLAADKTEGTTVIRFSSDGNTMAVSADYISVSIYDTITWRRVERMMGQHKVLGFIDEGRKLLTWSTKQHVFESNLETGEKRALFPTEGGLLGWSISPDERTLATSGYFNASVSMFSLDTGRLMTTFKLEGKTRPLVFSPDGTMLVGVTIPHDDFGKIWYGTLRYWRAPTLEKIDAEIADETSLDSSFFPTR